MTPPDEFWTGHGVRSPARRRCTHAHTWWPRRLPALVVRGVEDRIVDQPLWNDAVSTAPRVLHRTIPGAAHVAGIGQPALVRDASAGRTRAVSTR